MAEYSTQIIQYQSLVSTALPSSSESEIYINTNISGREVDRGALYDPFFGADNAYSYTQYFKMRGYSSSLNAYETWTSDNFANLNPPSGNALTDIVIVAVWFA